MTRSFTRLALRALMSSLALGLVAAGATGTAAFAAGGSGSGTGTGTAASSSNPGAGQGTPAAIHPGSAPGSGSGGGSAASGPAPVAPTGAAAPGSATAANSANGNKGHIQIEGAPDCTTSLCGEDNDPHVEGCTLTVELFGYPSGTNSADLTISGQAPSGDATVLTDVFTFTVPTTAPPNGSHLDTSRTYTPTASQLALLTPQANQGYHLRIDVAVNGFPAKTHVVWLDCAPTLPASTGAMTGSRGFLRPIAPAVAAGSPVDAPDAPVALAGARGDSAAPASSGLAFTGLDVIAIVAAAAVLLLAGVGFVVLSRRAKRVST